jgi:hypothetical protein
MTTLTEGKHTAEFLVHELPHGMSRSIGATLVSGQDLDAGTVLGVVTLSGKYAAFDQDASDGTEDAAGILYGAVDASGGDQPCVVIFRDADVNSLEIGWPSDIDAGEKTAAIAQLEALGIRLITGY